MSIVDKEWMPSQSKSWSCVLSFSPLAFGGLRSRVPGFQRVGF